jgi:hypothetical protein
MNIRMACRILLSFVAGLVTFGVLVYAFASGPLFFSTFSSPSIVAECSAIHAGMNRKQVLTLIHRRVNPDFESYSNSSRLTFYRGYTSCIVTFDPQSQAVTTSSLENSNATPVE